MSGQINHHDAGCIARAPIVSVLQIWGKSQSASSSDCSGSSYNHLVVIAPGFTSASALSHLEAITDPASFLRALGPKQPRFLLIKDVFPEDSSQCEYLLSLSESRLYLSASAPPHSLRHFLTLKFLRQFADINVLN